MKPTNLCVILIHPVNIGLTLITKLEIDLTHINHGLDHKTKRYKKSRSSNFSEIEIEIANIFYTLDGFFLNPLGKKDDYLYFDYEMEFLISNYKLAFCIHKQSIQTAGIITFYKIKTKD